MPSRSSVWFFTRTRMSRVMSVRPFGAAWQVLRRDVALPEVRWLHDVEVTVRDDVLPDRHVVTVTEMGVRSAGTSVGAVVPPFVRTTGLQNWNRYAAVNDEFIDIHMDDESARAVGMPGVFGMGNLRIAYLHNMLRDWVGDGGDIAEFRCEFRGTNLKGDTLTGHGAVTDVAGRLVSLDLGVTNQDGVETTPATATVVVFEDGGPRCPRIPGRRHRVGRRCPGRS